jgi:hypothetical protein
MMEIPILSTKIWKHNSLTILRGDGMLNPLKPKIVKIIFKNSVCTSKKTQHFTITKINWLMLFEEIMPVYSENHTRPINTKCTVSDC